MSVLYSVHCTIQINRNCLYRRSLKYSKGQMGKLQVNFFLYRPWTACKKNVWAVFFSFFLFSLLLMLLLLLLLLLTTEAADETAAALQYLQGDGIRTRLHTGVLPMSFTYPCMLKLRTFCPSTQYIYTSDNKHLTCVPFVCSLVHVSWRLV